MLLTDFELESAVRLSVFRFILAMHDMGWEEIHMGGLLRLFGIENEVAQKHDSEYIVLTKEDIEFLRDLPEPTVASPTLH